MEEEITASSERNATDGYPPYQEGLAWDGKTIEIEPLWIRVSEDKSIYRNKEEPNLFIYINTRTHTNKMDIIFKFNEKGNCRLCQDKDEVCKQSSLDKH